MIEVVGGSALGPGRLQKRLTAIRRTNPGARALNGNYLHFVDVDGKLTEDESRVLHALLTYGPRPVDESAGRATVASGRRLMVVPRLGTISPWSSKATDIAQVCGLQKIRRIERAVSYVVSGEIADEAGFVRVLADRMTESVLDRIVLPSANASTVRTLPSITPISYVAAPSISTIRPLLSRPTAPMRTRPGPPNVAGRTLV